MQVDDDWTTPDTWLVLLEKDGRTHVDASDEGAVDVAVTRYLDSGCTRDEVLCLTFAEGGRYHVRASQIVGWWMQTPEHCRRNLMRTQAQQELDKEQRTALGLPWKEDDQ